MLDLKSSKDLLATIGDVADCNHLNVPDLQWIANGGYQKQEKPI